MGLPQCGLDKEVIALRLKPNMDRFIGLFKTKAHEKAPNKLGNYKNQAYLNHSGAYP